MCADDSLSARKESGAALWALTLPALCPGVLFRLSVFRRLWIPVRLLNSRRVLLDLPGALLRCGPVLSGGLAIPWFGRGGLGLGRESRRFSSVVVGGLLFSPCPSGQSAR